MSRNEKLIEIVENHRKGPFPFADLRRYLELYGWRLDRQTGSHVVFVKTGAEALKPIPVDRGNTVKASYVRQVVKRIKANEDGPTE